MLRKPFCMPKVNASQEIALVAHRKLLQDFFYIDVRHLFLSLSPCLGVFRTRVREI